MAATSLVIINSFVTLNEGNLGLLLLLGSDGCIRGIGNCVSGWSMAMECTRFSSRVRWFEILSLQIDIRNPIMPIIKEFERKKQVEKRSIG